MAVSEQSCDKSQTMNSVVGEAAVTERPGQGAGDLAEIANRGGWPLALSGLAGIANQFEAEQDRWFLWSPVALGAGIGVYLAAGFEPQWWLTLLPLLLGSVLAWFTGAQRALAFALALGLVVFGVGVNAAKLRSEMVAAPKLSKSTGPMMVEGWVESITPRPKSRVSLLVRVNKLEDLPRAETPYRAQISVSAKWAPTQPGGPIKLLAMLRPPPRPVAPGAFDFSRRAYFMSIGAYGYGISKPILPGQFDVGGASPNWLEQAGVWIDGVRTAAASRIMTIVEGPRGGIAAALLTGKRNGIGAEDLSAIRDAGLAHLLAISGLHMALMSGAAFWAVRFLIAAFPWLAVRIVGKKWAAGAGLLTGFLYFFLAGGSVATERAFIMVAVSLLAIMVDRPAISLRNVALAAIFILLFKPETLAAAGFQMSFAAVVALTAFYEQASRWRVNRTYEGEGGEAFSIGAVIFKTLAGVVLTTLIASLATGPLAAFQFNRVAIFGLASNFVAVPLVGFAVMPLGLLVLILMPFGLDGPALSLMGAGTGALLDIAHEVAAWPGAVTLVPSPQSFVVPLMALGGLWLCLWRLRWRYFGLIPCAIGLGLSSNAPQPDILVDEQGRKVAVRLSDGLLALSNGRGGAYESGQWLRRDGDARAAAEISKAVAGAGGMGCDKLACVATAFTERNPNSGDAIASAAGTQVKVAFVRKIAALEEECHQADIVISAVPAHGVCNGSFNRKDRTTPRSAPSVLIDFFDLYRHGAHAITLTEDGPKVARVSDAVGNRPWARTYNAGR